MRNALILIISAIAFISSNEVNAAWVCTHGNSAVFETPAKEPAVPHRFGWGVDFSFKAPASGGYDWIHYAVPTNGEKTFSRIRIDLRTWNTAVIRDVHLWNGGSIVVQLNNVNISSDGAVRTRELAIGSNPLLLSAGVSLHLDSAWDAGIYPAIRIARICVGP